LNRFSRFKILAALSLSNSKPKAQNDGRRKCAEVEGNSSNIFHIVLETLLSVECRGQIFCPVGPIAIQRETHWLIPFALFKILFAKKLSGKW
jgi:hypothetical protein